MAKRQQFSERLAAAIVRYSNPAILGVVLLALIMLTETKSVVSIIVIEVVLLVSFVISPFFYIRLKTAKNKVPTSDPTLYLRAHPKEILALGLLFGLPCLVILIFLEAPVALIAALTCLLGISIIVAIINLRYRLSYHLAALTAILITSVMTWGSIFIVIFALIPLVSWAKFWMRQHTITQMLAAISLAIVVTLAVFYLFGLWRIP